MSIAPVFWKRISRWAREEGWRSFRRKVRQTWVYWKFRAWVSLHKKRVPAAPDAGGTPVFSILLSAYRTRPSWLRQAVRSVQAQGYARWELCIGLYEVDPAVVRELENAARADARIRLFYWNVNLGISGNSNLLAREARGEYVAILDHDDYLEPHALAEVASRAASGKFDLLYTDEDLVSGALRLPSPPNLKPDWAPETFHTGNYICHFCCVRRSLFEDMGGFRSEYDGAQDYDLFLRASERARAICHIPKVLYHWRRHGLSTASGSAGNAKPYFWEAGRRALQAHLDRVDPGARAEFGHAFGTLRVRYRHADVPRVEIIIPSANRDGTLERCLDSIAARTRYAPYRVTVMLNGPENFDALRAKYSGEGRFRFLDYREPFNFSRINNLAAAECDGEMLVFLNDDIEITEEAWIEELLQQGLRPEIGAVGPMLLYPNGTLQHAGISVDRDFIAFEMHKELSRTALGYHGRAQTLQNVSAVTGACLATRRECFLKVGGFDEAFPLAYNDIDYCLKLIRAGYRVVYTPFVALTHHESLTRGYDLHGEKQKRLHAEMKRMRDKWGDAGLTDRYFNAEMFKPGADLKAMARAYWASPPAEVEGP